MAADLALSVSDAVELAKGQVSRWPSMTVVGEVSGLRGPNARSGHCYFEVKDDGSAMSVIVWRGTYQKLGFQLRDGLEVQLTGKFDIYKGSGKMSFVASRVSASGEGLLRQQIAELARRLEREGLMDASRKRPIPAFCTRVCVVTSLSGSVIDDVKRTLARRNPLVLVDAVGCSVQGREAPATILRALDVAAAARPDAILLVRGGGSLEDLMCFNDESVARAIAACPVPVITGVGHEPDVTIADMVADRRCSTPTATAESVAPAIDEVERQMGQRQVRLGRSMAALLSARRSEVESLARVSANAMGAQLAQRRVALDARAADLAQTEERLHDAIPRTLARRAEATGVLAGRLSTAAERMTQPHEARMARLAASLDALSPLSVLSRGYAIATDDRGHVLKDASEAMTGQDITVRLGRGAVAARVTGVTNQAD